MASLRETLEAPIPPMLMWIGFPFAGLLLTAMFVFLGFPYDELADLATRRVSQATQSDIRIGEVDARITIGGPGFRVRDISVTTASNESYRVASLSVRPAWSLSWLTARPALRIDAEAEVGNVSGVVKIGRIPPFDLDLDLDLEAVDLSRLPIALPSDIALEGHVSGNLDMLMAEAGPDGSLDLEATSGTLSHPMLPIAVEYETLSAQVSMGGEQLVEIERLELDGPALAASITGTIGHGENPMEQALDVQIDLLIKDRMMLGMLRQLGVKLQPDGRTKLQVGGTAGRPAML
jgi:type II secretion system protein N